MSKKAKVEEPKPKPKPKPKNCVFCGGQAIVNSRKKDFCSCCIGLTPRFIYWVECESGFCEICGPNASSERIAVETWNKIAKVDY